MTKIKKVTDKRKAKGKEMESLLCLLLVNVIFASQTHNKLLFTNPTGSITSLQQGKQYVGSTPQLTLTI